MRLSKILPAIFLAFLLLRLDASAQELKAQPIPFTVWLDLKALAASDAARPPFPIWLESLEIHSPKPGDTQNNKTTFRIRIRKFAGLSDEIMLRVFFDDLPDAKPVFSGWSELGAQSLKSTTLGQGLGLPTSEVVAVSMDGVDYLDIDVPGDGSNVRGAFLSTLRKVETRETLDFSGSAKLADPFSNLPPAQTSENDSYLLGRVKATLQSAAEKIEPGATVSYEFQLDAQPLLAVVTFEILNSDLSFPPNVSANTLDAGPAAVILPDLADPGYQGSVFAMQSDVRFRYGGWLKCQKILRGSSLRAGVNQVVLSLDKQASPAAVRSVEMQLKYKTDAADLTATPR